MNNKKKILSVVFPVYQNAKNLPHLLIEINDFINNLIDYDCEFIFVDDGSTDSSFKEMKILKEKLKARTKLIQLTKNFGQLSALQCGWKFASGDFIGVISSDQQDPLLIFKKMLKLMDSNTEIVLATRSTRNDGLLINLFSNFYYIFVKKFIISDYPRGGCDVYLFSKSVKEHLLNRDERGNHVVASLINSGFYFKTIPYDRKKRKHGKNQTKILKRITIFIDVVVTNSYLPIRLISFFGLLLGISGIIFGIIVIIIRLNDLSNTANMGWASIIALLSILSGMILFSLGVIGEYFWRMMENIKKPMTYAVKKKLLD
ncbi:MAG: glycosyltransferase [Candidatus Neomarinimicrobiota bacterium]